MKKALKVVIPVLVIATVFLFVQSCGGSSDDVIEGATFEVPGDLAVQYGKAVTIKVKVPKGIKKAQVLYEDSLVTTFTKPGEQKFNLSPYYFGLGAKNLVIRTFFEDGTQQDEAIIVRVLSDIAPEQFSVQIVKSYPHNKESYTQGLEYNNGQLDEGTADPGRE